MGNVKSELPPIKKPEAKLPNIYPRLDFNMPVVKGIKYYLRVAQRDHVVYHGGKAMGANVEFPIGKEYYDNTRPVITREMRQFLTDTAIPGENREKFLNDYLDENIEGEKVAYFGEHAVASAYSECCDGCDQGCIGAYRLVNDMKLLDLTNHYNIYHLLYDADLPLDTTDKIFFGSVNNISDVSIDKIPDFWDLSIPENPKIRNHARFTMRNEFGPGPYNPIYGPYNPSKPPYFIIKPLLKAAAIEGASGLFNTETITAQSKRPNEIIIKNPQRYFEREYSDGLDWQTRNNIPEVLPSEVLLDFYKSMLEYKTLNIDFHAGDLYAHSIWVALFTQENVANVYHKFLNPDLYLDRWSNNVYGAIIQAVKPKEAKKMCMMYCKFAIIGAFLHDIGKMGGSTIFYDKPEHPRLGYDYLMSSARLSLESGKLLDPDAFFEELAENGEIEPDKKDLFKIFIMGIVLFHWDFGDAIRRVRGGEIDMTGAAIEYITKVGKWWLETTQKHSQSFDNRIFDIFLSILILVSMCDIKGSSVYKSREPGAQEILNAGIKGLWNAPQQHKGGRKFEEFEIDSAGQPLFDTIMFRSQEILHKVASQRMQKRLTEKEVEHRLDEIKKRKMLRAPRRAFRGFDFGYGV